MKKVKCTIRQILNVNNYKYIIFNCVINKTMLHLIDSSKIIDLIDSFNVAAKYS